MKHIIGKKSITAYILFVFCLLILGGCKDEDIDVPAGGTTIDKTIEEMNTNLRAYQKLIAAKAGNKAVRSCIQISNSTYQVELEDGNSFNFYTHVTTLGKNEGPVYFPVVSALQSGNNYYWTLDGSYLTNGKAEVLDKEVPVIDKDSEGYWTVAYGEEVQQLAWKVENGTVKSLFGEVDQSGVKEIKFLLRGDLPALTLARADEEDNPVIDPTYTLRRPISPEQPAWLVHIDTWNYADPQAIIDLIPDDIRPYVIFNISLSVSQDNATGEFNRVEYGYETAKSWLRTCAENNVWAMIQPASGGHCHFPDITNPAEIENSLFKEFYEYYPNFVGFNYCEQGWGFDDRFPYTNRLKTFKNLIELGYKYGGYLCVSYLNPSGAASNSAIALVKRDAELAQTLKTYPGNFITCEKFTQTYGFFDMESTSLGMYLSGYAGHYGMRFDQSGWWSDQATGNLGWNNDTDFPPAAGAIPVIEHAMFTGQTIFDGPELIWQQCFTESNRVNAGDGYTKRSWNYFPQFENISMDIYRKIIDGTIRILSRKEVIDRTKLVVINDITPGNQNYDPGYSPPANLFQGLYLMDEDGIQTDHHLFFKKTGRYPAIPTAVDLADDLAGSFEYKVNASQFTSGSGWGDLSVKTYKFNQMFPEEYTSGGMYAGRHENGWVAYNAYADIRTASIPFRYNTCEKMELAFGKYSVAVIKEFADKVDFYLTNYNVSGIQTTDVIVIHGSSKEPTYTFKNRGTSCYVSKKWENNVLTLTVKHNGGVDITVNCGGIAADRETFYTHTNVSVPNNPAVYTGPRQYEAEYFEYKNVASIETNAVAITNGKLPDYTALGYINFGTNYNAAVRDYISVTSAGTYSISIKYIAPTASINTVDLYINGSRVTTPEFTQTNPVDWQTVAIPVSLNQGQNKVELKANGTGAGELYFDHMIVKSISQ